jgi:hypothetical protein
LPFLARGFTVLAGTLDALGAETLGNVTLGLIAHANSFPEEAACVALVQGLHYLFAAWD